jgi:hypothetical protein
MSRQPKVKMYRVGQSPGTTARPNLPHQLGTDNTVGAPVSERGSSTAGGTGSQRALTVPAPESGWQVCANRMPTVPRLPVAS